MKMHSVLILASTLALSPAIAEPFNERGGHFVASVKFSIHSKRQPVVVEFGRFNERGEDFIVTAPVGSHKQYPPVAVELKGFNERGEDFIASVRSGANTDNHTTDRPLVGFDY